MEAKCTCITKDNSSNFIHDIFKGSRPLVSVIIPTYNAACYISETLDSVLSQTYQNLEVLIIDDKSTDNTLVLAHEYALRDRRIKVFSLEHNNGGPAAPRNYGIRIAQGEYIAFLDSDDLWLPEKVQKQVNFLENNKDVFLLYSQCIIEKDKRRLKILPKKGNSGNIFKELYLNSNFIGCLTVMMRNRKSQNTYFFDEDRRLIAVEDYAMWLSIALKERIFFMNEPLAIYRIRSTSISSEPFINFRKCSVILKKFRGDVAFSILIKAFFNFYIKLISVGIINTFSKTKSIIFNKNTI